MCIGLKKNVALLPLQSMRVRVYTVQVPCVGNFKQTAVNNK